MFTKIKGREDYDSYEEYYDDILNNSWDVKYLLSRGFSIEEIKAGISDFLKEGLGISLVHDVVRGGDLENLIKLVNADAPLDTLYGGDHYGNSVLGAAVIFGHKDIVEYLMSRGAPHNINDLLNLTSDQEITEIITQYIHDGETETLGTSNYNYSDCME